MCSDLDISYPKLIKEFDNLEEIVDGLQVEVLDGCTKAINLQIDATFFGREYGFLVIHDTKRVIYLKEIIRESVISFREAIVTVKNAGYVIKSITIDGKRGYIKSIRKLLGPIPIQMCLFHQKAIIRRYITDKPQSELGRKIKELMHLLTIKERQQEFINQFYKLQDQYYYYLQQKNEQGHYKYTTLRSAMRSIDTNMYYLFTYTDCKSLNIPPTINHLEGLFGHLKERIKIHRGLDKNRKKKAVRFLLKNLGKKT